MTRMLSAGRSQERCARRAAGFAASAVAALLLAVPASRAQAPLGALVSNVGFPARTLVLSVPRSVTLASSQVHITENGGQVRNLSVTSLKQAGPGDLGVVIMIDTDPSMSGTPLDRALAAARTVAAERTAGEQLGVVFGNGEVLPLTSNSAAIDQALAHPRKGASPLSLLAMTQAAVNQLAGARIADRAIIYVTDDIDRGSSYTLASLGAYAVASRVRIFTVGVHDRISTHPLPQDLPSSSIRLLANEAGGTFSEDVPAQLRKTFTDIAALLTSQYVVHYRSLLPRGDRIWLSVRVDGVPTVFNTTYTSPSIPRPLPPARAAHRSFWHSSVALIGAALVSAALIGLAVAVVLSQYVRAGELRGRVQSFLLPSPDLPPRGTVGPSAIQRTGVWERVLQRRRWWPGFVEKVDLSSISRSAAQIAALAVVGSIVAALLIDVITGSALIAILGLVTGPLVARALVNRSVAQNRTLFMEQLPGQLHEVASAMRTGRSILEAIRLVGENGDEPMRRELQRALTDERAGLHLDEALLPIGERMQSAEIEQVSVVAALHRRTGANITEVLDRVADTARERVEIRRELSALTAQARLSRNILVALPVIVVIALDLIGHTYERPLFHTVPGVILLVVGALMITAGAHVMKRIVTIEE